MLRARPLVALALVAALLPASARAVAADAPVPLDYRAYDGWNQVRTPVLSDDGRYFAYALTPQDGDPTLVVRDLDSGTERREARGTAPQFVGVSHFVVFTHVPPKSELDRAKKDKRPPDQQPKNGLGILDLRANRPAQIVDAVRSFVVPHDGGNVFAYRAEPSPTAKPTPAAASAGVATVAPSATPTGAPSPVSSAAPGFPINVSPAPGAFASASPSPSPSSSPAPPADKTKDVGSLLTIRDLVAATTVTVANVSTYAVSDDDRWIAYATETRDGKSDGVHVYDVAHATTIDLASTAGRYRDLAFAHDGSALAYLSDTASYAGDVPHDALYVTDLRAPYPAAHVAADLASAGMPPNTTPNYNGALRFSRDGMRVFLGTAAAPTPAPANTPVPTKVDMWSWQDDILQSEQRHDADAERKRTYAAVFDRVTSRFAQLGSVDLARVDTNENPHVALGIDQRAYRRAASWLGERYADLYAVSLSDGARKLLARGADEATLSPGGGYVVAWDASLRHWSAIATASGKRVELAPNAGVRFDLENDDHPAPPQPYGVGGWLRDDRGILLYDRYDVWLASPTTGTAVSLTRGAGRRTHTVFSPLNTDPDAQAFAPDAPILLSMLNDDTYASGYARVAAGGGTPTILFERDEQVYGRRSPSGENFHDLGLAPLAARHADRYAFTRESFRMTRNVWVGDASFAHLTQVTDANPQQAKYRWGSERLIHFRSLDGTPLKAVMLVPDGLERNRRAPLLVYFYERYSDTLHTYEAPGPGTEPSLTRYVSNGYVVLLPDVHYRPGHPGPSAYDSLMPAVDAAVRTGYIDEQHMGISGHSWAAYQINYLITKTHRFRAAEAGAAVDDMFSAYGGIRLESGNVRESQYEHGQSRIGATPWDRPDLYLENSGLFGIKNVTTPYLTMANDNDGAVPQFQGIEYITAMRRLGKVAYLFAFDGEEHGLRDRENQKYWTVHLDEWFDYWLKGAPRPAWMDGVPYLQRGERDVRPLFGEGP